MGNEAFNDRRGTAIAVDRDVPFLNKNQKQLKFSECENIQKSDFET